MRSFLEHLFGVLGGDIASLRQEIANTTKELKRELAELEQSVDTVERSRNVQVEELNHHRQELLTLQESNCELQYRLEDLEKRSRHSNTHIRRVSMQTTPGSLEDFVIRLFRHMTPALTDQEITLDCMHRVGQPSWAPSKHRAYSRVFITTNKENKY
ncbi:hypothetical protein NDU88_003606 [Pleurodeles waltl]|uniref:Uncharacterized protein n=1 Tax=Pleurodeles waltl TaxID=8319 RepID=A0AAV7LHJ1_PLEWA|nr:hypothetical protein NDU88_003606 [Pleurodeles waltl]